MKQIILLSFLVLIIVSSCGKVKDPEFRRLESFAVKSFGIQKVDVGFRVTYFNPNSFGVSVKEAGADFIHKGASPDELIATLTPLLRKE